MFFNVSQLMKEHSGASRQYAVDTRAAVGDDPSQPVHGRVRLLRTDRGVWVSASLDSQVVCSCSRCLAEYLQPIHMDIEEEFLPTIDVNTGARLAVPREDDENFYIDHNHILDLSEAVRQYSYMSVPMKPVCRQDCPGLCTQCGANLNDGPCPCDAVLRDSRWGPLLDMVQAAEDHRGS